LALPDLQMLLTSGSPVRPEEKQAIAARLTPRFFDIYGSAPIGYISVLRPEDFARPESVGRPLSTIDFEIVDERGRRTAPGVEGHLRCRSPGLTSPAIAASADDFRDGWFYPGEIAALDQDGYLFLHGRSSELIFRGGAKISPSEVENALQEHGSVLEAVVVARNRANNEQEAIAYVVASRPVSVGELLAHCRARLSSFKVPSQIHVIAGFPRTPTGKVDKQALIAGNLDPDATAG
jgi:acyl-coenzyme A synthetase/AMP-(fatty) acid ligase